MDYESEYDGSCGRSHHGHHGHHSHIRSHHHRGRSPSSAGRSTPGSDSSGEQAKSRMRWILSLGLLLPALAAIIGVVAWAVSAEVVMGARRESAFKLSGPASRFHQSGHRSEDDFDIDRLDLKTSDIKSRPSSSSSSVLSSSSSSSSSRNGMSKESRIIGDNSNSNSNNNEMNSQSKSSANNGLKPGQSNDRNGNVYFLAGLDALNSEARPNFQSNPSDSSKKSAGARVAEVIDRLVSQRKSEGSSPHIVVVAPLPDKSKKSGSGSSSQTTTTPKPSSTPSARSKFEEEPGAFSRDADTLLAAAHLLARHSMANKRSDDERGIFSIESNSDKPGFESANLLAQASSPEMDYQLPPHQQSQFTRQPIGPPIHHGQGLANQQHHQYQNQHGQQSQQNQQGQQGQSGHQHHGNMMSAASQHHPTYSLVSSRMGHGPMQGHHIFRSVGPQGPPVHSNHGSHQGQQQQQHHQMMSAASNQNNPTYAFAPQGFRHYQGYPEGLQGHQQQQGVPQGPPLPQQQGHHQVPPQHMNGGQGPARDYNAAESYGRPAPYINRDSYVAQESAPLLEFQASQLPHEEESGGYQESNPAKGLTLHFGGGPVGGGGQVMTSPLGIFKSLLLPLLPKPRVNLNGKVVFGVVLEKGVGYGKQKHHPPPPPPHHAFHHFGKRR